MFNWTNLVFLLVFCSAISFRYPLLSITALSLGCGLIFVGDKRKFETFAGLIAPYFIVETLLSVFFYNKYIEAVFPLKILFVLCIFVYVVINHRKMEKELLYIKSLPRSIAKNTNLGRQNYIKTSDYIAMDKNNVSGNMTVNILFKLILPSVWGMLWDMFHRSSNKVLYEFYANDSYFTGSVGNYRILKKLEWVENFEVCYSQNKPSQNKAVAEMQNEALEYKIINIIALVFILAFIGISFLQLKLYNEFKAEQAAAQSYYR